MRNRNRQKNVNVIDIDKQRIYLNNDVSELFKIEVVLTGFKSRLMHAI